MAVAFALVILGCVGTGPATNETCNMQVKELAGSATMETCEKLWNAAKDKLGVASSSGKTGFIAGHMCIPLTSLIDKHPPTPKALPTPVEPPVDDKQHV